MKSPGIAIETNADYSPWSADLGECFPDIIVGDLGGAEAMYDAGKLPYIHPMFKSNTPQATIQRIAAGVYDTQLYAWLRRLKAYCDTGRKAVVAYLPEMNGNWCVYATDNSSAYEFKRAWKSFVNMARELGISGSSVQFCWAPNDTGFGSLRDWYPGDAYVDIVGGSAYNWGGIFPNEPWESFTFLADRYVREVRKFTQKPIVITQTGSVSGDSRTPAWLDDAVFYTKNYNNIDGFIWFNLSEFLYEPGVDDWNRRVSPLNVTEVCSA